MPVEAPSLRMYSGLGITTPDEIFRRDYPRFYKREDLVDKELVPQEDMGPQEGFQIPRPVNRYLLSFRDAEGKLGHIAVPDAISPPILESFVNLIPPHKIEDRTFFQNQVLLSPTALDLMIRLNTGLIYEWALKYTAAIKRTTLTLEDLVLVGRTGMIRAIETFDLDKRAKGKAIKFSTHATWWIKASINRTIQEERALIYVPVHVQAKKGEAKKIEARLAQRLERDPTDIEVRQALEEAGFKGVKLEHLLTDRDERYTPLSLDLKDDNEQSLYDKISETEDPTTERSREEELATEKVEYALNLLPPNQARIVRMREGLGGTPHYTHKEIAQLLNLPYRQVTKLSLDANHAIKTILEKR